jgi:hypothetical protein
MLRSISLAKEGALPGRITRSTSSRRPVSSMACRQARRRLRLPRGAPPGWAPGAHRGGADGCLPGAGAPAGADEGTDAPPAAGDCQPCRPPVQSRLRSMRPFVLEMGLASEAELEELDAAARARLEDPRTVAVSGLFYLVWGRKPPGSCPDPGHPPSALSCATSACPYGDQRLCRWKERRILNQAGGESQEGCPEECQSNRRAPGTA